jgi:nicotinamidase/pyrazinamidase
MKLAIPESALIIIDVQNDFCPAGALAITEGDKVIPVLNALSARFSREGGRVVATQDWHPPGHVSFGIWPDHCVQGTAGADFHRSLDTKPVNLVIRKGFRPNLDSYSAFFENDRITPTGLEGFLRSLGVKTVVLGGLATDYCVLYSVLDAAALGFKTLVLKDAIRGVGLPAGSVEDALSQMEAAGAALIESEDIA